jgi:hypothetical protein
LNTFPQGGCKVYYFTMPTAGRTGSESLRRNNIVLGHCKVRNCTGGAKDWRMNV